MSHLAYSTFQGAAEKWCYSQVVRIGDRIECAGQGGWHTDTGVWEKELDAQVDLAFENVEKTLKIAGGKGWEQVFRVNSYHAPMTDESLAAIKRGFEKWMPDHNPIWTCVGVTKLGADDMLVEIEVVAHDPK